MQNRLSKKQRWFKNVILKPKDRVFVGLDVHKRSISVAIWHNDRLAVAYQLSTNVSTLQRDLKRLQPALRRVVYEAGPTGYGLARTLGRAGIPIEVISPANTPRPSKRTSKTDSLDCRTLAEYASKNMLHPITLPTEDEEQERQWMRLRDQLMRKQRRVCQQIKSFLLQYGIAEPMGLQNWTVAAVQKLQRLRISVQLRFTLDRYLEEFHFLRDQLQQVKHQLQALGRQAHHRQAIEILQSHPGVGWVTAWSFRLEVFRPERFDTAAQVSAYLGLSPQIQESGETRRDGPITKTGRPALRSLLIEAAWIWIRQDPMARKTYGRLCRNTGQPNKAIVGMARRLTIHLWRMLVTHRPYRPSA